MGRFRALSLTLALAAVAALTLAACGSGEDAELLPGTTAAAINENLDSVEALAAEQDCSGAANAAEQVSVQIEELSGVDKELKQALRKGATRLEEVVAACEEEPEESETTEPVETEEPSEDELREEEREQKAQEKAEKDAEKEREKEEKAEKETPPVEPPGQKEKEEKSSEPPPSEEEGGGTPSGGVAPGVSAEGGE